MVFHTDSGMAGAQDDEWTKTTFRLPKSLLKAAKHFATDHEVTDTEVFNDALRDYLEKEGKKPAKGH